MARELGYKSYLINNDFRINEFCIYLSSAGKTSYLGCCGANQLIPA